MMRSWRGGLVALLLPLASAPAQSEPAAGGSVRLGLWWGVLSFSGAAEPVDPGSGDPEALPWRPAMTGMTASLGSGRFRVLLSGSYGSPGLAVRGSAGSGAGEGTVLLVADNAFHLASFGAAVSLAVMRFSRGPSLRPSLGAFLERWSAPGMATRSVAGARAGILVEVPLTRTLAGTFEGAAGYSAGSPFDEAILPEGFRQRSTWRRGLAAGVSWRP